MADTAFSSPCPNPPIHVRAFGADGSVLTQIGRIRDGFVANGVVLVGEKEEVDLVYSNDAGTHETAIVYRDTCAPKAKLILNVLDLPLHLLEPDGDYTYSKMIALREALGRADAITAISEYTSAMVCHCFGLSPRVIYNPVKPVSPAKREARERPYPYRALMVGRVNDSNKRQRPIGIPALIAAGYTEAEVAVVGGEWPGWGTHLGAVSDETLNDLYNSVDFVMYPSRLEGLGLPPLEGMICGAIPLVCHDLTTITEMPIPRLWWTYPSAAAMAYRLRVYQANPLALEQDRAHCLYVSSTISERFSGAAVAKRILDVYASLVS